MGVTEAEFYDTDRIAIIPMGFCFPGLDKNGGDLAPRRECAAQWRGPLLAALPGLELMLLVGHHAHRWHLPTEAVGGMANLVEHFADVLTRQSQPRLFPLPHPSWRNNAWLKANPWFETRVVPRLRLEVRQRLGT